MSEQTEILLLEVKKLHERYELSKTVTPEYFEPGMMEYLDQSEGIYDSVKGELLLRFEVKGTRYEGRTEYIEKMKCGDEITVLRERENLYNVNNFTVINRKGHNVGNLPAALCNALAPLYDEGELIIQKAFVSFVEPITKRSRHAKQAILFVEMHCRLLTEIKKAEEVRIAEEKRKAEEARIAEEKHRAEEARIAEEKRKAEEARIAEEKRKAEEARIAEEKRKAEEARIAEEKRKAEEARIAEEKRKAEEARIAEEKRKAEEARIAEEKRKAEEARIAEEKRKAEEARIAEEKRRAEEARIAEEKRRAEEARIAEEKRKAEEARIAEEKRKAEEARIAEEKRKNDIYTFNLDIFHNSMDISELVNAMIELESIIDWKETIQLLADIQAKITEIQLENQRAERRHNKVCQHCGGKFKGFFTKRCSVCNKPKDY